MGMGIKLGAIAIMAGVLSSLGVSGAARAADPVLTAVWNPPGQAEQQLQAWSNDDLRALRSTTTSEREADSRSVTRWRGVSLGKLVEAALGKLPPESKARVDWVILTTSNGTKATIPRSFLDKYPLLLALQRGGETLEPSVVVPWTSHPLLLKERLPVESYAVHGVVKLELANSRELFSSVVLKRRTDPAAIRGEKLLVETCVACHASKPPNWVGALTETKGAFIHPAVRGAPRLGDRDQRALASFGEELRREAPPAPAAAVNSAVPAVRATVTSTGESR
jgi:hypothetical protein